MLFCKVLLKKRWAKTVNFTRFCAKPERVVWHDVVGYFAKLTGEGLSRYLKHIESIGLRIAYC